MATIIKPELSEKNKYWIDKHRHYELKHFCLQYPVWKKEYNDISVNPGILSLDRVSFSQSISDPTLRTVIKREKYLERIKMIELAAKDADSDLYSYILKGVTEGMSYNYLQNKLHMPCSRNTYYDRYRRFFWLLNKLRD